MLLLIVGVLVTWLELIASGFDEHLDCRPSEISWQDGKL